MTRKNTWKKRLLQLAGLLAVLWAVFLIVQSYMAKIEHNEVELIDQNLKKMSESNVTAINFVFQNYISNLKATALAVEQCPDFRSPEMTLMLDQMAKTQGFERLAVDFPDGTSFTSDGHELDISGQGYLEEISQGNIFIQDVTPALVDGTPIINIFVPLHDPKSGHPVAALRLAVSTETLTGVLEQTFFSGDGYYRVVDKNGSFVAENKTKKSLINGGNFYDTIKQLQYEPGYSQDAIYSDFQLMTPGYVKYSYGGMGRFAYYEPVGINEWMLISIIPQDVAVRQEQTNIALATNMSACLLGIMLVLFVAFFFWQRRSRQLAELNDTCFRVLAEQMNKTIFEWDFYNGKITSTTNFSQMFGREAVTRQSAEEALNADMVHADDREVFAGIFQTILHGDNVSNIHFRVKNNMGVYKWCSLSGVVIKDHRGRPYKAIGSLDSIHEQVEREAGLKQKAEHDELTGLFNKAATEFLIKETLTGKENSKGTHALFIIDVDNFKNVNDKLGHLYGDMVLTMLADSLKPLFRSGDVVGRIGGDEFFVLLKNYPTENLVLNKAQEICRVFQRSFTENDTTCEVSASVGIALYPQDGTEFDTLYKHADAALYLTKERGKNGFTLYDGTAGSGYVSERTAIEGGSGLAQKNFDENRFEYFFRHLSEAHDPLVAAQSVLQLVVARYKFSGCTIFEIHPRTQVYQNIFECLADGAVTKNQNTAALPLQRMAYVTTQLMNNGFVTIRDTKSLPEEFLHALSPNICALHLFAMKNNENMFGFIAFDDCHRQYNLTKREQQNLTTICDILTLFISKQRLLAELEDYKTKNGDAPPPRKN